MANSNMLLLNWNVTGLNAPVRCCGVGDMARAVKATVVCLQETKLHTVDELLVFDMLGTRFR
jgi:exonuclease III